MKRVLLMALAAVLLAAPAANAQKVNEAAIQKKLAKSNADIADAKKSEKGTTWLNRAKVYFESVAAPTKDLYENLTLESLDMVGTPQHKSDTEWDYEFVTVNIDNGRVVSWVQKKEVYPGAIDVALEALEKAHELDPKLDPKIKSQIDAIVKHYRNQATVMFTRLSDIEGAYKCYEYICKAQLNPAYGEPSYDHFFIAGQFAAFLGPNDVEKFVLGDKFLTSALDAGYTDPEGEIYYYAYHCYYGQREQNPEKLQQAKTVLLEGISKFPQNEHILEGLMALYTSEEGVGDPTDLVTLIEERLEANPADADLWYSRGRVYYKLDDVDECINSFAKLAELKPELYDGHFYLGMFYQIKGEKLNNDLNARDYKSQREYDADMQEVYNLYKKAVPELEKAVSLNPSSEDALSNLKMLCFRLRDDDDIYMEKYDKYNNMLNALK